MDEIRWTSEGLIPVIAQQADTGKVLMFAWMNRESLALTVEEGYAVYWSRSRNRLWRKGEESGHRQKVISLYLDCDEDVILLAVDQHDGIACHTGRHSCFYRKLVDGQWQAVDPVLKDPKAIYNHE
nr:phosphoribosyl-AMP cyclohydrolase [Methylicorpusculum oleiharenae]